MYKPAITGTGVFTPEHVITNDELVESFNQYATKWNEDHAAEIEAGELEAKDMSSSEFIFKASGIEQRYVLDKDMTPINLARQAMKTLGITPTSEPLRGGTDGSRLTELGLPAPNLFTGMQEIHGPLEWISVQDMNAAAEVCVAIAMAAGASGDHV